MKCSFLSEENQRPKHPRWGVFQPVCVRRLFSSSRIRAHYHSKIQIKGLKGKPSNSDQAQLHLLTDPRHNPRLLLRCSERCSRRWTSAKEALIIMTFKSTLTIKKRPNIAYSCRIGIDRRFRVQGLSEKAKKSFMFADDKGFPLLQWEFLYVTLVIYGCERWEVV